MKLLFLIQYPYIHIRISINEVIISVLPTSQMQAVNSPFEVAWLSQAAHEEDPVKGATVLTGQSEHLAAPVLENVPRLQGLQENWPLTSWYDPRYFILIRFYLFIIRKFDIIKYWNLNFFNFYFSFFFFMRNIDHYITGQGRQDVARETSE